MKHYLDLVPISAKVHRRQSRMTVLCIVISVFLVTAIFSLAEAFLKMELSSMTEKHGGWHFKVSGLSQQQEADLSAREDVLFVGESAAFNEDGSEPYRVEDSRAVLYGIVVGLVTVLLAAQAPAKRAASVPPMTAVSGNVSQGAKERHGVRFGTKHIEIALGVHHATAAKKN